LRELKQHAGLKSADTFSLPTLNSGAVG